jgi:hypothetical protein
VSISDAQANANFTKFQNRLNAYFKTQFVDAQQLKANPKVELSRLLFLLATLGIDKSSAADLIN